jgi:hypothetical protein
MIPLMPDLGWPVPVDSSTAGSETGSVTGPRTDPALIDPAKIRKNVRNNNNGSGFIGVIWLQWFCYKRQVKTYRVAKCVYFIFIFLSLVPLTKANP